MPFVEYKVQTKAMAGGTGLSVSLRKSQKGRARTSIFLSAAVAATLGWKAGDSLDVLLGTEEQHGAIRLRTASEGSGTAVVKERQARGGAYFAIELGTIDAFVDRKEEKRFCNFERVEGDWVEIVLPKWADETHPTKKIVLAQRPAPIIQSRPTESRPPLGQRTTVVRRISMGDPPPGRSALNNRSETATQLDALHRTEGEIRRTSEAVSRDALRAERQATAAATVNVEALNGVLFVGTQRKLLALLIDGLNHTLEDLAGGVGTISKNSVPSIISLLRTKLRPGGISIETIEGGFAMKPEMAEAARALLQN